METRRFEGIAGGVVGSLLDEGLPIPPARLKKERKLSAPGSSRYVIAESLWAYQYVSPSSGAGPAGPTLHQVRAMFSLAFHPLRRDSWTPGGRTAGVGEALASIWTLWLRFTGPVKLLRKVLHPKSARAEA